MSHASLVRNASWNAIVVGYRAATNMASVFLAARLLGPATYGHLATMLAFFTLYVSFASGTFVALVPRLIASAEDEGQGPAPYVSAALFLASAFIAGAVIIGAALYCIAPYAATTQLLDPRFWTAAATVGPLLALLAALQIFTIQNAAILEGGGRLDAAVKAQLLGSGIMCAILVTAFVTHTPLTDVFYVAVLCLAAAIDAVFVLVVRHRIGKHPEGAFRFGPALQLAPELLKSGSTIQLTTLLNILLDPFNKLLLGQFAGAEMVTAYDIGMKLVWGVHLLFGAFMRVFLHISGDAGCQIAEICARILPTLLGPALLGHGSAALLLAVVIHYWIPLDPAATMSFFGIASIANLLMIGITPFYMTLVGRNDRSFLLRIQLRLAICNVLVSLALVPVLGLVGSSVGLLLGTIYNFLAIWRRFAVTVNPPKTLEAALVRRGGAFSLYLVLIAAIVGIGGFMDPEPTILGILAAFLITSAMCDSATREIFLKLLAKVVN